MKQFRLSDMKSSLSPIYNRHDPLAQGRMINLIISLLQSVCNVFITGIFYTGFLSMYDISITNVGIISFIPYIANCFSIFTPVILPKIKHKKRTVLFAELFYYGMYILATNLMPLFVKGNTARVVCFSVIIFLGYGIYSLFFPIQTTWFYRFYPEDNGMRTRYLNFNQIFSSIMSSFMLIFGARITDALANSPMQDELILALRYFAFVLAAVSVYARSRAVDITEEKGDPVRLRDVFTLPFRYQKFMRCLLLIFAWAFTGGINSSLWGYHLLNHLHFSYTLINLMSVEYTVILLLTSRVWRRLIGNMGWIKVFGLVNLLWLPTEVAFFFMSQESGYLYVPWTTVQNILNVGLNLSYANILYMNLPEENSNAHISFYILGYNAFAFLGMMLGTVISGISGDSTMVFLGMEMFSVQFTTVLRDVFLLPMGLICFFKWRAFTKDSDIQEYETLAKSRRRGAK